MQTDIITAKLTTWSGWNDAQLGRQRGAPKLEAIAYVVANVLVYSYPDLPQMRIQVPWEAENRG